MPTCCRGREGSYQWRALQVQQQGSTLQQCQHRTGAETGSTAAISLSNPQPVLLAKKSSLPRVPVGAKCDARPQLHPRQSTPRKSTSSFALVCSNILWPAKELGAGSGREVGRDARRSHASPLLPTKTAAPSYSAHVLGVLFRSQIVSRAKATHALPSERGELWKIPSQQFSKSRCNTAVLGG